MPTVPPINVDKFLRVLERCGCREVRQRGSHRAFTRPGLPRPIIIAVHGNELPGPFIRQNLKALGVSVEEYLAMLDDI